MVPCSPGRTTRYLSAQQSARQPNVCAHLFTNYRSHPALVRILSKISYNNKLVPRALPERVNALAHWDKRGHNWTESNPGACTFWSEARKVERAAKRATAAIVVLGVALAPPMLLNFILSLEGKPPVHATALYQTLAMELLMPLSVMVVLFFAAAYTL